MDLLRYIRLTNFRNDKSSEFGIHVFFSSRWLSFIINEESNKISTLETVNTQMILTRSSVLFSGILVAMIINTKASVNAEKKYIYLLQLNNYSK